MRCSIATWHTITTDDHHGSHARPHQTCDGSPSSTAVPCAGTSQPITGFEAEVYVNGENKGIVEVPLSAATPEIQPTPQANATVYNIAIPVPLTEFQMVNVSIRAVNDAGKVSR